MTKPGPCLLPQSLPLLALLAVALGALLSACGGGGGGAESPAAAAAPAPTTTAAATDGTPLSAKTLAGKVPESYRPPLVMPDAVLGEAHARLPSGKGPTYLQLWIVAPGETRPSVLWIGRWAPGGMLPRVQVPLAVSTVSFEMYNAAGTVSGTWSL